MATPPTGIPTTYRRTQFRSRLEARWASFFDGIGWRWEYEPFDADGYVPDFLVFGPAPLLVEVKPVYHDEAADDVWTEILDRDCGLVGELLVVGVSPILEDWFPELKAHDSGQFPTAGRIGDVGRAATQKGSDVRSDWGSDRAVWGRCGACGEVAIWEDIQWYRCRPCGHYEGDHYCQPYDHGRLETAWAKARNGTQWMAPR